MKDENKKIETMSVLIFKDPEGNVLKDYIDTNKLDFSIESLKIVNKYLEKARWKKSKLNEEELKKIILRCGTYLGEVIRKDQPRRFTWISYETASKFSNISFLERSLLTHIILYDKNKELLHFPLNKVYKFLENGKEDNILAFAMTILKGL